MKENCFELYEQMLDPTEENSIITFVLADGRNNYTEATYYYTNLINSESG